MTILGVTESFKMMKMMEEGGGEQVPPPLLPNIGLVSIPPMRVLPHSISFWYLKI